MWQIQWSKIWHVNSSGKIHTVHSLPIMHENWAVSFTLKSSLNSQLNKRTWPQSRRKPPCRFNAAFFTTLQIFELLARPVEVWSLPRIGGKGKVTKIITLKNTFDFCMSQQKCCKAWCQWKERSAFYFLCTLGLISLILRPKISKMSDKMGVNGLTLSGCFLA